MFSSTARVLCVTWACVAADVSTEAAPCAGSETCLDGDEAALLQRQRVVSKTNQAPEPEPTPEPEPAKLKGGDPSTSSLLLNSLGRVMYSGLAPLGTPESDKCAVVKYKAKYALPSAAIDAGYEPPFALGTDENMDPKLKELGLDFTGIWWMRGNPVAEELVSFAGTTANSSTYPATLAVPTSAKGHWSWNDDVVGNIILRYYSPNSPNRTVDFDFESAERGKVSTGLDEVPLIWVDEFPFAKINDDEWLRPTYFQNRSVFSQTNYTLTRVINGDGTPHPEYWPAFLEHMTPEWSILSGNGTAGDAVMMSWYTDDLCRRLCEGVFGCTVCKWKCNLEAPSWMRTPSWIR